MPVSFFHPSIKKLKEIFDAWDPIQTLKNEKSQELSYTSLFFFADMSSKYIQEEEDSISQFYRRELRPEYKKIETFDELLRWMQKPKSTYRKSGVRIPVRVSHLRIKQEKENPWYFSALLTPYMEVLESIAIWGCIYSQKEKRTDNKFNEIWEHSISFDKACQYAKQLENILFQEWENEYNSVEDQAAEILTQLLALFQNSEKKKPIVNLDQQVEKAYDIYIAWICGNLKSMDLLWMNGEDHLLLPHSQKIDAEACVGKYYTVLCKTALYLLLWLHNYFSEGYVNLEADEKESSSDYIVPVNLPATLESFQKQYHLEHAVLLCGGGGSGKSTYLQRLAQQFVPGNSVYTYVQCFSLKELITEETSCLEQTEFTEEVSLFWQDIRQKILSEEYASLIQKFRSKKQGEHFLFLLDGYNEILNLNNRDGLLRLQDEIEWLLQNPNVQILLTVRAENQKPEEVKKAFWWYQFEGRECCCVAIDYGNTLEECLPKPLKGKSKIKSLIHNKPMYLQILVKMKKFTDIREYIILHHLYNSQCDLRKKYGNAAIRNCWNILYTMILPEIAYRMLVNGMLLCKEYWLEQQIKEILQRNSDEDIPKILMSLDLDNEILYTHGIYPFENNSKDVRWILDAIVNCDVLLYKSFGNSFSFFHEDIQKYLAARHIEQRLQLYRQYPEKKICYSFPIQWETLDKQTVKFTYQAIAAHADFTSEEYSEQFFQQNIFPQFPYACGNLLIEDLTPGILMQIKIAAQLEEYDKEHRDIIQPLFRKQSKFWTEGCSRLKDSIQSIDPVGREALCRLLFCASQMQRLSEDHPVPETAYLYAEMAYLFAKELPQGIEGVSLQKIAKHYLAKAMLYQAQYLWKHCPEQQQEAEYQFREGYQLLRKCAQADETGIGLNLSCNLLALWKSAPAPFLRAQPVFRELVGDLNPIEGFLYFFQSIMFAPKKSALRPYAARKCLSMLLEQQVLIRQTCPAIKRLEELPVVWDKKEISYLYTPEKVVPLSYKDLKRTLQIAGLLEKEIQSYTYDTIFFYSGLLKLYYSELEQVKKTNRDILYRKSAEHDFNKVPRGDIHYLKAHLCLDYLEYFYSGSYDLRQWEKCVREYERVIRENEQPFDKRTAGKIDQTHESYNLLSYRRFLDILECQIAEYKNNK